MFANEFKQGAKQIFSGNKLLFQFESFDIFQSKNENVPNLFLFQKHFFDLMIKEGANDSGIAAEFGFEFFKRILDAIQKLDNLFFFNSSLWQQIMISAKSIVFLQYFQRDHVLI